MSAYHCNKPGCRCTHDSGCEYGWVENHDGKAVPCPICHFEKLPYPSEDRREWLHRLRSSGKGAAA